MVPNETLPEHLTNWQKNNTKMSLNIILTICFIATLTVCSSGEPSVPLAYYAAAPNVVYAPTPYASSYTYSAVNHAIAAPFLATRAAPFLATRAAPLLLEPVASRAAPILAQSAALVQPAAPLLTARTVAAAAPAPAVVEARAALNAAAPRSIAASNPTANLRTIPASSSTVAGRNGPGAAAAELLPAPYLSRLYNTPIVYNKK